MRSNSPSSPVRAHSPGSVRISSAQVLDLLDSAAEHLMVRRDFTAALNACDRGLETVAGMEQEDGRCAEFKAGFCILGIQALAELNQWECVLSWVLQQYELHQKIPAKIMQMCILLYSKVGEQAVMQEAARVWLHSPSNRSASGFGTVAELYLLHVLVPLGRTQEAQEMVAGDVGAQAFTEGQRQTALEVVEERERQSEEPPDPSDDQHQATPAHPGSPRAAVSHRIKAVLRFLHRSVSSSSGSFSLHTLLLAALLLYLLLVRMDPALPFSFVWISKLLQLLRQMWNAMFAPYHQALAHSRGL